MLSLLNKPQKEAVLHEKGPLLILAGAGSGKTKALTHRLAYLVKVRKTSPYNILCLTFTNKAAGEMKERTAKLLGIKIINFPWMGTFHSVCARILRREIQNLGEGFAQNFTIYDEDDSLALIKKIMKEFGVDNKKFAPEVIKSIISRAKQEAVGPKKFQNQYVNSQITEISAKIFQKYEKELRQANALDFDNLINKTIELFKKEKPILKKFQNQFLHILVDEYQDTNRAQYLLLKLLAKKHHNICVVGDDWQSIYRFRGADFRNILDFKKDYPETKIIKLEENYRSTGNIIDAAQSVIENNTVRSEKKLFSRNPRGEKVKIFNVLNQEAEGELIIKILQSLNKNYDKNYQDSVILYRTNAQSRALEEILLRYSIPYRIIGGLRFYERKEIKDIIAYLKIIDNPNDLVSLRRIINTPPRGISRQTIERLNNQILRTIAQNGPKESELTLNPRAKNAVLKFSKLIQKMRRDIDKFNDASEIISYVLKKTGYKEYLLDGTEEGIVRYENIQELKSVATTYSSLKAKESLRSFLEEVTLLSEIDNYDKESNAITLMTLHNAKGLEFKNVFITGLEEGLFPHSRSRGEPEELEEERRLFYVGMTRAMERLHLISATERLIWGGIQVNPQSRFIEEISPAVVEFADSHLISVPFESAEEIGEEPQIKEHDFEIGDRIDHSNFGRGTIAAIDDEEIIVRFEKLGEKRLSPAYAPIKKVTL